MRATALESLIRIGGGLMTAKEKENNSTEEEERMTEEQKNLIVQLYLEIGNFPKEYPMGDLLKISKKAANTHIQLLLEYKKTHNGKTNSNPQTQFKDVSFGMIYKLVWRHKLDLTNWGVMKEEDFIRKVFEEYVLYLKTRNSIEAQFLNEAVK